MNPGSSVRTRGASERQLPRMVLSSEGSLSRQHIPVRPGLFWAIAQRLVVIPYRRFGTTYMYLSHLGSLDP